MRRIERIPRLNRAELSTRFLEHAPPVVITDELAAWAGSARWTFDELRRRWGSRTVLAWVTPDGEWDHASEREDVPFAELIDAALGRAPGQRKISGPQLNLEHDIPWAAENVGTPAFVPADRVVSTNLWLQAAGDKTHLHWDYDPGVLGLLHGEKEIALFPARRRGRPRVPAAACLRCRESSLAEDRHDARRIHDRVRDRVGALVQNAPVIDGEIAGPRRARIDGFSGREVRACGLT